MIAPLRHTHHIVWTILALVLPVLLATALLARRDTTPINRELRLP